MMTVSGDLLRRLHSKWRETEESKGNAEETVVNLMTDQIQGLKGWVDLKWFKS